MYNILHEINMAARDEKLLFLKRERDHAESQEILDPNMFPINRLSEDLVKEYDSVWNTKFGQRMLNDVERYIGHSLRIRNSSIDHHLAGRGVFVSCKRQGIVLPGTLLGIFPGTILSPNIPKPETPRRGCKPYLERPDGFYINYETELPYPLPKIG
mmetsp:Transcript_21675/g.33378  ORF Transcript_21675/g.33378 Transcript_21675/m.33378 type:complete len:156 (+) Transcript_21675:310-777(+)